MLMIRLQRVGRKNDPAFRLVVTEHTNSTKSGRYLEVLGSYDARKTTEHFDADKIKHWMSKGAKTSDTVHNILVSHKIIEGKKKNVLPKKSPIVDEAKIAAEKAAEEAKVKAAADAKVAAEAEALAAKEAAEKAEADAKAAAEAPVEATPEEPVTVDEVVAEVATESEEAPAEVVTPETPEEVTAA